MNATFLFWRRQNDHPALVQKKEMLPTAHQSAEDADSFEHPAQEILLILNCDSYTYQVLCYTRIYII